MRLLSLELEKFGAFADCGSLSVRTLDCMSSTGRTRRENRLRFRRRRPPFGVPERTPYASRFPGQLRVGAEIAAADGRRLKFWRRKGRRTTLLDGAGDPLPDDALAPFSAASVGKCSSGRSDWTRRSSEPAARKCCRRTATLARASWRRRPACGVSPNCVVRLKAKPTAFSLRAPAKTAVSTGARALQRRTRRNSRKGTPQRCVDKLNKDIEELGHELDRLRAERRAGDMERFRLSRLKRAAPLLNPIREAEEALSVLWRSARPGVRHGAGVARGAR